MRLKFYRRKSAKVNVYSSCFKIPEAAVNLQRRALGKRNNVKRLKPTAHTGSIYSGMSAGVSQVRSASSFVPLKFKVQKTCFHIFSLIVQSFRAWSVW
ncbi:MAG: hypothetical protein LBJ00_11590 [Planctomycetaceae bacterium]|nr:hypothetical protein [Planctomycetaceae bacterium]